MLVQKGITAAPNGEYGHLAFISIMVVTLKKHQSLILTTLISNVRKE